jgi:hypothetical protein
MAKIPDRVTRIALFVILPLLANAFLAFAIVQYPAGLADNPTLRYLTISAALGPAFASMIGFFFHDLGPKRTLLAAIFQGIALVFIFAGIYQGGGLLDGSKPADASTALYFSIITWTSVGYGDLTPPRELRMIAAMEAVLGYIFLATLAAIASTIERPPDRSSS